MLFTKEIRKRYLGFDDFWLFLIGVPLIGFAIHHYHFEDTGLSEGVGAYLENYVRSLYFTSGYWLANCWMIIQLRIRLPDFKDTLKRIILQLVLSTVVVLVTSGILILLLKVGGFIVGTDLLRSGEDKGWFLAPLFISFFMLWVYETVYFYYQLQRSIMEKESVKRAHIQSQWEGLRNQVNPHFLFNSMNTLMNIIGTDQDLAKRFLVKLSKVYRYILESREDPLIPMKEELEFIYSYVFLQQERFKGNLKVQINIPKEWIDHYIVPLSLQVLFENAIKHNVISSRRPLQIDVSVSPDGSSLEIRNNLQRKSQVIHSTKVGLENLQKRYELLTGRNIEVLETGAFFSVSIPLIPAHKIVPHEDIAH